MKRLLIILLSLLTLLFAGFLWLKKSHSPVYKGELEMVGLQSPVDIRFDQFGIPHIGAAAAEDAYQALGYVHAMERLFQMEMMRRVGTGTLAELLGPDLVKVDKFFRTLGIPQHAIRSSEAWNLSAAGSPSSTSLPSPTSSPASSISPASAGSAGSAVSLPAETSHLNSEQKLMRKCVDAYIRGVNAFIQEGKLPIEYTLLGTKPRPFTLTDIHAIIGYMSFTFASALKTDPLVTLIERKLGKDYLDAMAVHTQPEHFKIPVHYPDSSPSRPKFPMAPSAQNPSTQTPSVQPFSTQNIMRKSPALAFENTVTGMLKNLPAPLLLGSNAWVIAPSRSASGKVLFANDTHIGFSQPSVWFEAHLEYPGFSFYGNHLAGVPFALVGHSRLHSYGLTMFINDDMDLYEEKPLPNDSSRVQSADSSTQIRERMDSILVKDSAAVLFRIRETHHGPIMNDVMPELAEITSLPVSSWWVYLQFPTRALEATWNLSHARSMQDAENAARLIHAPGLNVMYGDADGNIAWWASALLPIRPPHVNPKGLLDGASGNDEILGWYPFENNPQSVNPPSGFVISANNQPDTMSNGVFFPGYYYPGDRYERIRKSLSNNTRWTQDAMKKLQTETINERHPQHAAFMLASIKTDPDLHRYQEYKPALDALKNWKGTHELSEIAPTLYYKWLYHTLRYMMEDDLGEAAFSTLLESFFLKQSLTRLLQQDHHPWWDDRNTSAQENKQAIISKALEKSLGELTNQFGSDASKWKWGECIISEHPHPLGAKKPLDKIFNVKTQPLEANGEGVNKLAFTLNGEGKYKVTSGPALRILLDFANVDASESVLPTGQSGNVFSPHYNDQAELYVRGEYRSQLMNPGKIRNSAHSRLLFKPRKVVPSN